MGLPDKMLHTLKNYKKLIVTLSIATLVAAICCQLGSPLLGCAAFLYVPAIVGIIWTLISKWKERAARLASLSDEQRAVHHALEELEIQTGAAGTADEYLDNLP